LYPLRNATNNAAVCLEKLQRYDEAREMFGGIGRGNAFRHVKPKPHLRP
jgi:hypothetical protein